MSQVDVDGQAGSTQDWREWAPRSVCSEREAKDRLERAERRWWLECREATVRAHAQGYVVVLGTGRHARHVGAHETYEVAEGVAVDAVRDARHRALGVIRTRILPGWSDDTPFMDATLGTAMRAIPLWIRRAPCSNDELGTDANGNINEPPVVAIYQGAAVVRPSVNIHWDDERSRAEMASRYASGMRRKQDEVALALQQFAQHSATANLVLDDRRLACREIGTVSGEPVVVLGPVRLDHDGNAEARVAMPDGTRAWLSIRAI